MCVELFKTHFHTQREAEKVKVQNHTPIIYLITQLSFSPITIYLQTFQGTYFNISPLPKNVNGKGDAEFNHKGQGIKKEGHRLRFLHYNSSITTTLSLDYVAYSWSYD
jgi:hypothetical protein